jgi:glycosyltransferase involved in cell wall biosynthesis
MFDKARSVAFFTPGWPAGSVPNGIATYVGEIRQGLELLGIETKIVTSHVAESASYLEAVDEAVDVSKIVLSRSRRLLLRAFDNLPHFHSGGLRIGLAVAQAAIKIGTERMALLEMEETFGAAWYAQQVLDVPVVVRLHGPSFLNRVAMGFPEDEQFHLIDRAERRCIVQAAGVTAPSRDVLERVRNRYGIDLADARVIPNPAPVVTPDRQWRFDESDHQTILFVGRFDRHKGGDIMIDAFREVARALPQVRLTFVGPDEGFRDGAGGIQDLPSYMAARLPPSIRERVQVTGPLRSDQIQALRRRSHVTVVPSRYETFCLALVESLAHGCPTIASNIGAIPDILLDQRTGLLFENGDPSDLARKIIALFEDPTRAAELGREAAADVSVRLGSSSVARATLDYYESLLSKQPRGTLQRSLSHTLYALTGGRGTNSLRRSL